MIGVRIDSHQRRPVWDFERAIENILFFKKKKKKKKIVRFIGSVSPREPQKAFIEKGAREKMSDQTRN
jgi:hypothetical protein